MKKYFYISLVLIFLGCKTTNEDETPLPNVDVSGKYQGIIAMTDLIGVPNTNSSKFSKDTLEVTVEKIGENYILHGFDIVDLTIPVSQQKSWSIPINLDAARVLSSSISFRGDSLTMEGNWRYTYVEGEYNDSSISSRTYSFIGFKK